MIVFCHLLNDNSGSPLVLRMAIEAVHQHGEDCELYVGSQGRGCLETAPIPIHRYWYRRSRFRIVTLITFLISQIALYRSLSRASLPRDAIIYVNTLLPFGAALWGHLNNRRVIYHAHEVSISPAPLRWLLLAVARRTAKAVFYVSKDQYQRLPVAGVRPAILPNATPPAIVGEGATATYKVRRSGFFEVLMLASPRDYKGVPEFRLLAARMLGRDECRFTLVLNGSDDEVDRYIPEGRRPPNMTVHSRTDRPQQYYAKADVLMNLSRIDQWVETFGLTIVEGMSFGLPVIVPPVGGPSEIVTEGEQGFLVDSRDIDRLEEVLTYMLDHPDGMLRISRAARVRAGDFTFDRFAERLVAEVRTCGYGEEPRREC